MSSDPKNLNGADRTESALIDWPAVVVVGSLQHPPDLPNGRVCGEQAGRNMVRTKHCGPGTGSFWLKI